MRAVALVPILCAVACTPRNTTPTDDAGWADAAVTVDASTVPADAGWDAGNVDAGGGPDAGLDAGAADAAVDTFEACCALQGCDSVAGLQACSVGGPPWGRCTASGTAGVCVDVSLCPAPWRATPGLCPGPVDIQCCHAVSTVDAGATSFEGCCVARGGCSSDADMSACSLDDPQYGRCSAASTPGLCVSTASCGGTWVHAAGLCPGPVDIQCCTPPSPVGQACTAADHPQPNVGITSPAVDVRCPAGMKLVAGTTCVDVWEDFIVEVLPDGGVADWSPYFNPGTRTVRAVTAPGAVPQGYINGDQAEAACRAAGKRLCTSTEWLRACRGSASLVYPYGNARLPGTCNDARSVHPAIEYFGVNDPDPFSKIQHPCLNQLPNSVDPTGARAGCTTEDGLLDMMGNLHEWVADADGTFRGGFYVDTYRNGNGCLYATTAHTRPHWDYSTGFRCCADRP